MWFANVEDDSKSMFEHYLQQKHLTSMAIFKAY